jgi:hypothetical protein
MRYILIIAALFCSLPQIFAQNNITYGAGISYTNGAPSFTPPARTSRVAIDTITGKWYHYNTPGGWQLLGNTIEEIAGCSAPAYTPTKGDSKVVINNCAAPELYYWTGSAWVWINEGTTYYAGEGIRIQNDSIILDSLYYLQFRTGDTTDLDAGRLSWNAQEGTLDVVINSGNVTGQVFEDVFFNCKNQTGSTITRGTVVMAVGTLGASGRILIAPAIADGSVNSEYILGTAAQDIANGSDGLVYHFGKDRGLNTTGASCGETWADRDVLYCSATTPGCLTKTIPTAPNLKVPVAIVLNAANNGTIFVRPSHFPDLNQINDVQLTSPTTGQTLIYNSVTGVWSNQTPADPSSTNELQTLSTGTNTLTLSNGGGTVTVDTDPGSDITGNGVTSYLPQYTGTTTIDTTGLFWNATTGRLGIRTTSPLRTLDVNGDIVLSTNNTFLSARNTGGSVIGLFRVDASNNQQFGSLFTGAGTNFFTATDYKLYTYPSNVTTQVVQINQNGNFGISTAGPAARLHVVGSGSTSTTWTAQFHNSAGNNNALMIRDDGRIGIGSTTLNSKLTVNGEGTTSGTVGLRINNNNGVSLLQVLDNGDLRFGNLGSLSPRLYTIDTLGNQTPDGHLVFFNARITNQNLSEFALYNYGGTNLNATSGTQSTFAIRQSFLPTSGSAIYNAFRINTTINQTGTSSGISRGLFISPILTLAADWRSIEWSNNSGFGLYGNGNANNYLNGNLGIKTTSPTDLIDINGANGYSQLRLRTAYTPTGTADANGNTGDVAWDDNYIYIKTAAGWKRSALSTF